MLATFRIRKDKANPYVSIHKGFLSDRNLSWRSKGILTYLLSKPDDWVVRVEDIRNHAREADRAVRSSIQELVSCGYLVKRVIRERGRFSRFEYDVYESPELNTSLFSKSTILLKWRNGVSEYREAMEEAYRNADKKDVEAQYPGGWSEDGKAH